MAVVAIGKALWLFVVVVVVVVVDRCV